VNVLIPVYRWGHVLAHTLVDNETADRIPSWRNLHLNHWGYATVYDPKFQRVAALHRFVVGLGHRTGGVVHHVNGDKLDNRRANLEVFSSHSEHLLAHSFRGLAA